MEDTLEIVEFNACNVKELFMKPSDEKRTQKAILAYKLWGVLNITRALIVKFEQNASKQSMVFSVNALIYK